MQKGLEVGSHVFIIESNRTIRKMVVAARRGEFYTLKFLNGGAIQLRKSRIFTSKDEAEKMIPVKMVEKHRYRSPYDYGL